MSCVSFDGFHPTKLKQDMLQEFASSVDRVERTNRATQPSGRSSQLNRKHQKKKSQRYPSSIALLKQVTLRGAKSPVLKMDMGTGTAIRIWSDAARNHHYLVKITSELAEILGISLADQFD